MRKPRITCLNVSPIPPEVCAELKARAALQRKPLYQYVSQVLAEHLAQVPRPGAPAPAPERASA